MAAHPKSAIGKKIRLAFRQAVVPPTISIKEGLEFWRIYLLNAFLTVGVTSGFIALFPSINYALTEKNWELAVIFPAAYIGAVCLLIFRRISFKIRAAGGLFILYIIGLGILLFPGLVSAGLLWFFAFSVIAGILLGFKGAVLALLVNIITLMGLGYLFFLPGIPWRFPKAVSADTWVITSLNFLFLNALVTISVVMLVRGLRYVLEDEKITSAELDRERLRLLSANEQLQREMDERRMAEEALKASEQRFRSVSENSPDIICTMGNQGEFTYLNPTFQTILGYSVEEALGEYFIRFVREEDIKLCLRLFKKIRDSKETVRDETLNLTCKDGTYRLFNISAAPNIDDSGQVNGVVGLCKDITEHHQMERQFQHAQKMEAVGTLAGGIAHDFNNILGVIIGFAELTQRNSRQPDKVESNLAKLLSACRRAKELVTQILTFSRQGDTDYQPILVAPIIKEALKLLRASLPSTITIKQNITSETGTVMADSVQIHQIIMNLCTNAAYTMREKGGVLGVSLDEISVTEDEESRMPGLKAGVYLRLSVRDTGEGMEPGVKERIFEPYFTTKKFGQGTGLGLSVVHGIVKSHQGEIKVYSEKGAGSWFNVYLPMVTDAIAGETGREARSIPRGAERVLFVDDEEGLVEVVTEMLRELGYQATGSVSSLEALELFKHKPDDFDLVITDMTMPNITGLELAREFLAIKPHLPVILCTGYSESVTSEKVRATGIKGFMAKPVVLADFASMIRNVLNGEIMV